MTIELFMEAALQKSPVRSLLPPLPMGHTRVSVSVVSGVSGVSGVVGVSVIVGVSAAVVVIVAVV